MSATAMAAGGGATAGGRTTASGGSAAGGGPGAVAGPLQLRPRLKPHVDFHRHLYRGDVWYVFHDRAVDRFYRVSSPAADLIGALDGNRTLAEICDDFGPRATDHPLDPQQAAEFVAQLHALGLLRTGMAPSALAIGRKQDAIARRRRMAMVKSPLAIRVPLFDPTWLLNRLAPLGDVLFSWQVGLVWCLLVLTGLIVGIANWGDLMADFSDRLLSLGNLGMVGAIYPLVKGLHELGHGMALRRHGAETRRMGIMFVAFIPMPYVDASSSVVLRDKHARMLVAGAGIMVELAIAALAMLGWALSQPGTFQVLCYNTLLITGLATLLFNGNPLQRYDGYYLLCDLVEIPSLGMRATQHVGYLFRRWVLADGTARAPAATRSERRWFLIYGVLSTLYRTWLVFKISFFVARAYPLLGTGLAVWSVIGMLSTPFMGLGRLLVGHRLPHRGGALLRLGGLFALLGIALFVVPVPLAVVNEGVIWLPDAANLRAQAGGDITRILVRPGAHVVAGQPVLLLDDPATEARAVEAGDTLAVLAAQRGAEIGLGNTVSAAMVQDRITAARAALAQARKDVAHLVVRSPQTGTILFSDYSGLMGRYLSKGQAPAVIWNGDAVVVRVMVPLQDIDLLRKRVERVQIRPGYDSHTVLPGHIIRIVPAATEELPSAVLSTAGGGWLAVRATGTPADSANAALDVVAPMPARLAEPMFEVDVRCDARLPFPFLNGRALVRFNLGSEPIGFRTIRWFRLTFLRDLHA